MAYLRDEFVGEQLFALERSDALVRNVREQPLAAIPARRGVGMCDFPLLVFVEEGALLTVHAERGDAGKLNLRPAIGAHERFRHRELLAQLREHPAVLGAHMVPRDVAGRGLRVREHVLADSPVGLHGFAVRSAFRRGILRTERQLRGAIRFLGTLKFRPVRRELFRKKRPDPRVQRAVVHAHWRPQRAFGEQSEQVLPVSVLGNQVHKSQHRGGEARIQNLEERVKKQPLRLPPATPPGLEGHHEEVLHHGCVCAGARIFENVLHECAHAVWRQAPDELVEEREESIAETFGRKRRMVVFPHRDAGLILATSVGRYGIAHARVGHLGVLRGTAAKTGIRPHSATRRAENPNLSESNTPNVTRLIRSSSLRGVVSPATMRSGRVWRTRPARIFGKIPLSLVYAECTRHMSRKISTSSSSLVRNNANGCVSTSKFVA